MYKVSWARSSDPHGQYFVLCPDVWALYAFYHVLTNYGAKDGCIPVRIKVTNLDGDAVDVSKGLADAAGQGSYGARQ
jgi:hypothetical protein